MKSIFLYCLNDRGVFLKFKLVLTQWWSDRGTDTSTLDTLHLYLRPPIESKSVAFDMRRQVNMLHKFVDSSNSLIWRDSGLSWHSQWTFKSPTRISFPDDELLSYRISENCWWRIPFVRPFWGNGGSYQTNWINCHQYLEGPTWYWGWISGLKQSLQI